MKKSIFGCVALLEASCAVLLIPPPGPRANRPSSKLIDGFYESVGSVNSEVLRKVYDKVQQRKLQESMCSLCGGNQQASVIMPDILPNYDIADVPPNQNCGELNIMAQNFLQADSENCAGIQFLLTDQCCSAGSAPALAAEPCTICGNYTLVEDYMPYYPDIPGIPANMSCGDWTDFVAGADASGCSSVKVSFVLPSRLPRTRMKYQIPAIRCGNF